MKKSYLIIIILIILFGAVLFYQFYGNKGEDVNIGTNIGDTAPDFTLNKVNGEELTLSDFQGKKVFINFWTTNCYYCRIEMPDIQRLYEEHKDIQILTVNIQENRGTVINYLLTNGYTFPALLDTNGTVAANYLVRGTPTTYILDENGIIINMRTGLLSYQQMLEILEIE